MSRFRSLWAVVVLLGLLVGTNLWWAYRALDWGVTLTYREQTFQNTRDALEDALLALPALAAEADRSLVEAKVADAVADPDPYEKEGAFVVGNLVLYFDADGRLAEATPTFDPW